jgi:hypothetical protein
MQTVIMKETQRQMTRLKTHTKITNKTQQKRKNAKLKNTKKTQQKRKNNLLAVLRPVPG